MEFDKKKLIKLASLLIKFNRYETDKGVIVTNEDLAEGVEVLDEAGEIIADGEYKYEEKVIVVKDGKVEKILEVEVEEEPIAEPQEEEIKIEEKKCDLEDEAIEEPKAEEEAAPAEPDEKDLKIKELEGLLADRDAVIEELTAKLKEMEDKVAKPVEEPVKMNRVEKLAQNQVEGVMKYFKE